MNEKATKGATAPTMTHDEAAANAKRPVAPDPLAAIAAEVDSTLDGSTGAPGEPDSAGASEVEELAGALELLAVVVRQLRPSLSKVWTPEAMRGIAAAGVPVIQKYGWTVGGLFAKFGPELGLIAAAAPVALGTAQVIAAERRASLPNLEKASAPAPAPKPTPAPAPERGGAPVELMPAGVPSTVGIPAGVS